jgi:hypothetical protein
MVCHISGREDTVHAGTGGAFLCEEITTVVHLQRSLENLQNMNVSDREQFSHGMEEQYKSSQRKH